MESDQYRGLVCQTSGGCQFLLIVFWGTSVPLSLGCPCDLLMARRTQWTRSWAGRELQLLGAVHQVSIRLPLLVILRDLVKIPRLLTKKRQERGGPTCAHPHSPHHGPPSQSTEL